MSLTREFWNISQHEGAVNNQLQIVMAYTHYIMGVDLYTFGSARALPIMSWALPMVSWALPKSDPSKRLVTHTNCRNRTAKRPSHVKKNRAAPRRKSNISFQSEDSKESCSFLAYI